VDEDGGQLKAGKPEPFLKSQLGDSRPAFSPDGRWLAYQSNASGKAEVYVRPFALPASGQGGVWPISNGGGTRPVWSPNGRDLLYQSGDQIMAVSYTVKGDVFVPEKPRVWISKLGAAVDLINWDRHGTWLGTASGSR
jgi:Tol biopolymer transport system component